MIAFLWAYNVVIISIVLTFKIIAWALRLFIVAPIQAVSAAFALLCTWLLYAAFAAASIYAGLAVFAIAVIVVFAYIISQKAGQHQSRQALGDSAHLFECLAPHGVNRARVQAWIESKSIRIFNKTTGKSFYPSSEICRLWPGDVVVLTCRSRNIQTQLEFEPKKKALIEV